jgi:tetratricopeptide (TPR) repeat protein
MKHAAAPAAPLVLALLAACASSKPKEESKEVRLQSYMETATFLYEDGSLVRAQDQAVKALELDPENIPMRRLVGWVRLRGGTNEDLLIAEEFFRTLHEDGDTTVGTLQGLAQTLERLGQVYDQASADYATEKRAPASGEDAAERARALADRARSLWRESIALYVESLKADAENLRSLNGLQRAHALVGEYEQSLGFARAVLSRAEQDLGSWQTVLQSTDLTEREESAARENHDASLGLLVDTHLFVASLEHKLGNDSAGVPHLDAVAELDPARAQTFGLRAQLKHQTGDFLGAIEDIDRFLRLSDAPFEHPDVRKAFDLREACSQALAAATTSALDVPADR